MTALIAFVISPANALVTRSKSGLTRNRFTTLGAAQKDVVDITTLWF